ncbi:Ribosomal S8 [Pyrenophora seminiperda CCB06]|uniref:Ribosomal S8 n=1 Tax=Pyrenophora seminiperda CCB06 TaxID=1302712 RepID=A0A3M7M2S1_9PLEO|nr:Ribosomal S8 [Pyrenophora seminiperda CCB06]
MPESTFSKMATELIEMIAEYLDNQDLLSLRLSCRKSDAQTIRTVSERFFSPLQTSLLGPEIQKLEEISRGRFAKYIKRIRIQDDIETSEKMWSTGQRVFIEDRPSTMWTFDMMFNIELDKIGVRNLQNILRTCQLRPVELIISESHDRVGNLCPTSEACATLAQHIFLDSNLAIASLSIDTKPRSWLITATASLIPEFQGRELGLSMLKEARVRLNCNKSSIYWTEQLVLHAPMLEGLYLSSMCVGATCSFYKTKTPLHNMRLQSHKACFQLKNLHLDHTNASVASLLNLLSNSKDTLVSITLAHVELHPLTEASNWTQLLQTIGKECLNLNQWQLDLYLQRHPYLSEVLGRSGVKFTGFGKTCLEKEDRDGLTILYKGDRDEKTIVFKYNGPGAARALYKMASYARLETKD